MRGAYYNEFDPKAAAWLKELIKRNLIADGEVDERSIKDVEAKELRRFKQCHFFAGIGVWSFALRLAGWPDDQQIWTGSCPCQPFSVSGKRRRASDERHLWPTWNNLVRESKPQLIFGEQVASDDGLAWLDLVHADLEGQGYTVGAVDTCAAGVGAPHIRQRIYFCANASNCPDSINDGRTTTDGLRKKIESPRATKQNSERQPEGASDSRNSGNPQGHVRRVPIRRRRQNENQAEPRRPSEIVNGEHTERAGLEGLSSDVRDWRGPGWLDPAAARSASEAGATRGFWSDCDWYYCRDGKYRAIGSGLFPLAHGAAERVGRLRGYGNAICAEQSAYFIRAAIEEIRSARQ